MDLMNLTDAKARLDLYLEAERRLLEGGQSYTIGQRSFSRADLAEIRDGIAYWQRQVASLQAAGSGAPSGMRVRVARWS